MMLSLLLLTLAVVVSGVLPAYALGRDLPVAVTLSAAVTLSMAGIGATISVATSSPLLVGVVPVVVVVNMAALWWVWHNRSAPRSDGPSNEPAPDRLSRTLDVLFVAGVLVAPALASLAYRPLPPVGYDPRAIFWFHAGWFESGGAVVRSSITNPLFGPSHPEYPPGPPGLIGAFWKVTGGRDVVLARNLTFILTAFALGGLAWLLVGRRRTAISTVGAVLFVLATPALAGRAAPLGYFDMLCAALLVSAVLAYRELPHPSGPLVGGALLMAASLTKGEGLFFGVVAAIVLIGCARGVRRDTAFVSALAFAPVVAWLALAHSIDRNVGEIPPRRLVSLAFLQSREVDRFRQAVPAIYRDVQPYLWLAVVVVAAAALALALERSRTSLTMPVLLLGLGLALVPLLGSVYAAGPFEINWWLGSSVTRVTTVSKLLFLGAVVRVLLAAAERERDVRMARLA